jgi:hypothetical protein
VILCCAEDGPFNAEAHINAAIAGVTEIASIRAKR